MAATRQRMAPRTHLSTAVAEAAPRQTASPGTGMDPEAIVGSATPVRHRAFRHDVAARSAPCCRRAEPGRAGLRRAATAATRHIPGQPQSAISQPRRRERAKRQGSDASPCQTGQPNSPTVTGAAAAASPSASGRETLRPRPARIAGDAAFAGAGLASAASCRPATSARPAAARGWAGDHVTHALTVVASLALGPAHPRGEVISCTDFDAILLPQTSTAHSPASLSRSCSSFRLRRVPRPPRQATSTEDRPASPC